MKAFFLAISLLCLLVLTACQTPQPQSASFASVIIPGKSASEICQAAGAVFQEDGYRVASLNPQNMIFQREGSRSESLAYGGVVDTHYGSVTLVRVRAQLVDLGAGSQRLQCKAYMVRDANDSFFSDETPLMNIRSGPYQRLLNKVAKRLKSGS